MTTPAKLLKICQVLVDAGKGDSYIQAEHDIIYIAPPDEYDEELSQKLNEAGCEYDPNEAGWHVTT